MGRSAVFAAARLDRKKGSSPWRAKISRVLDGSAIAMAIDPPRPSRAINTALPRLVPTPHPFYDKPPRSESMPLVRAASYLGKAVERLRIKKGQLATTF